MKQLTFFSLFLIMLCFMACSNSKNTAVKETIKSETVKANAESPDLVDIKSILNQLNKDYISVLTNEEMALSIFYDNKEEYIEQYKKVIGSMDYMSKSFKEELIKKLESTTAGEGESNLRKATDPLFETTSYAEKIEFTGSDIDEGMAAIGVVLTYPLIDSKCCPSDLFFKKIDGKWLLTGHDISR